MRGFISNGGKRASVVPDMANDRLLIFSFSVSNVGLFKENALQKKLFVLKITQARTQ